ncbi:MAG: hypothetical protein NC411_04295 [Bacteroides sp.]|nr:hypothetical protein [Bacteroides sp.]
MNNIHHYIIRQWLLLRMAASEFYFKQPFDIKEEYPIMTSILGFALTPIYMIFGFLYARIYGSLASYRLFTIILMFVLCFGIAFLIIRNIKNVPFIHQTISEYEAMDLKTRKKIYSAKNMIKLTFIMAILPWIVLGISVAIICYAVPHA